MASNGVIFSDGVEADYLEFNSGAEVKLSTAPNKAMLVVDNRGRTEVFENLGSTPNYCNE